MIMVPGLPGSAEATALQPIPYRAEPALGAGKALSVFGLTVVLLVVAVGLLLWARKRGWLQRWTTVPGGGKAGGSVPRVLGQTRLGHASHAFVIDIDGARFIVVESSRNVALQPLPDAGEPRGEGR